MKNTGAAFLTMATILGALTIAIAKDSGNLGKYEWTVPYLIALICLFLIIGIVLLAKAGQHGKERPEIFIKYHWRESAHPSDTYTSLNAPVILNNVGNGEAVNIQIEELTRGPWVASFPLIPHIPAKDKISVLADVKYDGIQAKSLANSLVSIVKPAGDEAKKESHSVKMRAKYASTRGDKFSGEYDLRWNHQTQECIVVLVKVR